MMQALIVCFPVDKDERERLLALTTVPLPVPSTEHTITRCERCPRRVWIGPQQLAAAQARRGSVICHLCLMEETGFESLPVVTLGRDGRPRTL